MLRSKSSKSGKFFVARDGAPKVVASCAVLAPSLWLLVACGPPPLTNAQLEAQKCQLENPITSYTGAAGASTPVTPVTKPKLVSCYQEFGIGAAEPTVVVSNDGTVSYAPVFNDKGAGLYQSSDFGETWQSVFPSLPEGKNHGRQQPYLFRDPATDRTFFTTTAGTGFDMTRSTDNFETYEYSKVALEGSDWMKMYSGPPVTSRPTGTPNVIYISAPSPVSTILGQYQAVYKSLDGGATFQSVGGTQLSLKVADFPDCPSNGWIIYGNGGVGPDGTVYISLHRCGRLAVAVSHDEGDTWNVVDVPGTTLLPYIGFIQMVVSANALLTEPLAVDSAGNVYLVWPDKAGLLQFSVSRDKAQTFSAPIVVAEPTVNFATYGGVAVRKTGTLAIAYYGSEHGDVGPFNGYIAETTNALDAHPLFQSALVNDPAKPLSPENFDIGYARLFSGGDLHEIIKPTYAPNGDIWAGFGRDMCLGFAGSDRCDWVLAEHDNSYYQGSIGRLVHR